MQVALEMLKRTRVSLLETTAHLSEDQLLVIPEGFNNNILWNLGHLVVSQQLLTYGLCGLEMGVSDAMLGQFRKGTSPRNWQGAVVIDELKVLALSLVEKTAEDFEKGVLRADPQARFPYSTSFAGELETLADAIHFNNLHEGLHLGTIRALQKFV